MLGRLDCQAKNLKPRSKWVDLTRLLEKSTERNEEPPAISQRWPASIVLCKACSYDWGAWLESQQNHIFTPNWCPSSKNYLRYLLSSHASKYDKQSQSRPWVETCLLWHLKTCSNLLIWKRHLCCWQEEIKGTSNEFFASIPYHISPKRTIIILKEARSQETRKSNKVSSTPCVISQGPASKEGKNFNTQFSSSKP